MFIEKFFEPEELNPCRDSVAELVEELAQKLYKAGKIKGKLIAFQSFLCDVLNINLVILKH